MSIKVTVNLVLDDEAGSEVEKVIDEEKVAIDSGEIEDIVAGFLKRLAGGSPEDIKLHIVGIEDIW